jgi:hypothetical protein
MTAPSYKNTDTTGQLVWDDTNKIWVALDSGVFFGAAGLVPSAYDYISVAYPDTVTEVYTFKTGGSGGTTVATITIVYTDATKELLSTVTKT